MKNYCTVSNKSAGIVVYKIPELNLRREFAPGEVKKNIPISELEQLNQIPGGKAIIADYLFVHDPEVVRELLNCEPPIEYWLDTKDIPNWMNNCSLEEFEDALHFAPDGTKDLIKKFAVQLPLNDFSKRNAIFEILGFDVTAAVKNNEDEKAASEKKQPAKEAQRKASSSTIKVPEEKPEQVIITTNKEG